MTFHQSSWTSCCVLLLLVSIGASGCGKSDAARMEEFRKYAGAGTKDDEEEDAPATTPAPTQSTFVAPRRNVGGTNPGSGSAPTTPAVLPAAPATNHVQTGTADQPQPAAVNGLSDTKSPPATPLSKTERRQMAIDNLTAIAKGFEAFRATKGGASYPPQCSTDGSGQPLLSWRVQLLPYLGYQSLYAQFRLNERWDSPHNQKLIDKIPSVYQSPERFDFYTNFVVPSSGSTAFNGGKVPAIRRWEDGLENSIVLVEVNDDKSVIWTQPTDLDFDPQRPREGLGALREDGFFAVWGGGELSVVPKGSGNLRAAFTVDGGDQIAATMKKPAMAQAGGIASKFQRGGASGSLTSVQPQPGVGTASRQAGSEPSSGASTGSSGATSSATDPNAQRAFELGRETDAIHAYYAAVVGDAEPSEWVYQFKWVPGLSRPAAIVRYGVAIEFRGPRAAAARETALRALAERANNRFGSSGSEKAHGKLTGKFGQQILDTLTSRPVHSPFLVVEEPTTPTRGFRRRDDDTPASQQPAVHQARLAPCVQFIGVDNERRLVAAARKHEVDALILFKIDEKNAGRDVLIEIIDVVRKKSVFATEKLNSRKVQAAKMDLVADDPTPGVIRSVANFLNNKLTPVELPSALRPSVAAKRVKWLMKQRDKNPLRTLAEIKLYRQLDLIQLSQQMEAYSELLGQQAALTLIGGSAGEKADLLSEYVAVESTPTL